MERNIRDVRDIFGRHGNDTSHRKQELRSYEYSPRSRRKYESMENFEIKAPTNHHHDSRSNAVNGGNTKNNRYRQSVPDDFSDPVRQSKKSDDHQKNASSKSKDSAYYTNRTLTERDIRHLERHLSMKKTIRKQISRNLAQAFVDEAELDFKDPIPPVQKSGSKVAPDRTFTLTRAKVSKSEQNVLDLLKDNEPDSGHCSADNPNSSDDDSQEQTRQRHVPRTTENIQRSMEKLSGNSRSAADNRNKCDQPYKEDGKFSFWKMFSVKNRGKR